MPSSTNPNPASSASANGHAEDTNGFSERKFPLTTSSSSSSIVVTKKYDAPGEQGKDEDDYIEKAQENTCTVLLKDEKHRDVLMSRLATLRRNRELCDVVLYAGEREIFAHKVVLAALSSSFFELFTSSMSNATVSLAPNKPVALSPTASSTRVVAANVAAAADEPHHQSSNGFCQNSCDRMTYCEFNDVEYDCFEALINYAYTGSLEISNSKVADLYKVAYALRIQPCVKTCAQYLAKILDVQNCIGIRKCANRTNDAFLGNIVDSFIQKNFCDIVLKSTEFTSLPCIQLEVILSFEDRTNLNNERRLGEKIVEFLQQQAADLPEHVEFRMEALTEKTFMLFLDDDMTLQDCCDMDDASSVGSCDLVQDYKKQNRRTVAQATTNGGAKKNGVSAPGSRPGHVLASPGPKLSRFSSTESMNSIASEAAAEEVEWKLIAIRKNSDHYFVSLAIVKRRLAVISVRVNDSPSSKPSLSDRLLLLAKMQEADSVPLMNMVSQRCSVGAVYLNGMLIVCGGYDRGECLKSVEQFDFVTNRWSTLAPMLKDRGRADACVCKNHIYVIGGSDGTRDLNLCERYDWMSGVWSKIAPLPYARSNNSAVCVLDSVFCVGGWNGQVAVKTCDKFDPETNEWQAIAPLLVGRYQAGCCEWAGKLVAAGGCDTWNCLNSVEIYDPTTNVWKMLPSMVQARRGCGATVLNDKLYVVGGSDGVQSLASSEILDLSDPNGVWRPGPSLNTPRGNVRLVTADSNRVFAVGGFSGKSFLNSIEYLDEGLNEWKTSITRPSSLQTWTSTIDEDPVGESQQENGRDEDQATTTNGLDNEHESVQVNGHQG